MIFLSYSHKDFNIVAEFYVELYKLKREEIWFGPEMISYGQDWENKVGEAIRRSRVILMLLDASQIDLKLGLNFNREIRMIESSLSVNSSQKLVVIQIGDMKSEGQYKIIREFKFAENLVQTTLLNFSNIYYGKQRIELADSLEFKDLVKILRLNNPE